MKRLSIGLTSGLIIALACPVFAGTVNFDFDSLSNNVNTVTVQSYLNTTASGLGLPSATLSGCSGSVVVCITNNAGTSGITSNQYTADGHVVGPRSNRTVRAVTLGTTDGAHGNTADTPRTGAGTGFGTLPAGNNDTFLYTSAGTYITITFSAPVTLISFDWEIFPNNTCTALTSSKCGGTGFPNRPDLKVTVNGGQLFHYYGVTPGNDNPSTSATDATYTQSWCGSTTHSCTGTSSSSNHGEAAPQLIGTWLAAGGGLVGVTSITFTDWPAAIGFDNLKFSYLPPLPPGQVPMPAGFLLMALGTSMLGWRAYRRSWPSGLGPPPATHDPGGAGPAPPRLG